MKHVYILFLVLSSCSIQAQIQTVGLFTNTQDSYNGYTLFSNNTVTYLIDNCGFVVNSWQSEYRPGVSVYLLENGNLLRTARVSGAFSGGGSGGLFELFSWDGDLLWSHRFADESQQSHHDIEPLPNGNFLALVWRSISGDEAEAQGRNSNQEVWIETIVEIEMLGTEEMNVVWEWSMLDHIVQDFDPGKLKYGVISEHPEKMDFNFGTNIPGNSANWAHANGIDYNSELDQVAISFRNFSEIWIIDKSTSTEEAKGSTGGNSGKGGDILYRYGNPQVYDRGNPSDQVFFNQHNVEWVKTTDGTSGELSIFNNNWQPNRSRVERWLPPYDDFNYFLESNMTFGPEEATWSYTDLELYSPRISGVQILPNKNALICEGTSGRFYEVTEDGDIVWDYINPVQTNGGPVAQGSSSGMNDVFKVIRYGADYPAFEGRELSPSEPIELLPMESDCEIYENMTSTQDEEFDNNFTLNNPISDRMTIFSAQENVFLQLYSQTGLLLKEDRIFVGYNHINCDALSAGVYFVLLRDGKKAYTKVIIKH